MLKNDIFLLLSIYFVTFLLCFIVVSYSSQISSLLELSNPTFNFTNDAFNNTNKTEDIIFHGNENQTRWITIPKNSTILSSNITLNGKITPVQQAGTGLVYYSVAVGNVTGKHYNDIVIGGADEVFLFNSSINQLWNYSTGSDVKSIAIGDVLSDGGNEIAVGSSDEDRVYILNSSGNQKWNYSTAGTISSVVIGNLTGKSYNDIAIGADKVYLLNSNGTVNWTYAGAGSVYSLAVGDINSDFKNEVIVGNDSGIQVLNSTGNFISDFSFGTGRNVKSLAVGDITSDFGNEIVAGLNNGSVYVLNSSMNISWTYNVGGIIYSLAVGDLTSDFGNEIAVGSSNNKLYALNSTGSLIVSYATSDQVRGVTIGDITSDPLNETVAASMDKNVYVLNLEYFPTNPFVDIGGNSVAEWNYTGKFRGNSSLSSNTAFQNYLDNVCNPNSKGNCDVPIVFHSDYGGDLNVTSINITYQYDASNIISYQTKSAWSRTTNVRANESVGNQVKNITYNKNPAVDLRIDYLVVGSNATRCDFNGSSYNVTNLNGKKVCDISALNRVIPSSGQMPVPYDSLWDDSMTSDVPIIINESAPVTSNGFWIKNLTIWNNAPYTFYDVIANTAINKSIVISQPKLLVEWYKNGTLYDITPTTPSNDCNSSNPTYQSKTIGTDTFKVCKQNLSGNGVEDLFVWKQPSSSTIILYQVSGSGNNPPSIPGFNVTPGEGIWGSQFNISANVSDIEGDNVTVKLLVNITGLNAWQIIDAKNVTGNQTVTFNLTTNQSWIGWNQFKFELTDFNFSSGDTPLHDWTNSSTGWGPYVEKHNVTITQVQGDNTELNRTNSTLFVIQINDTSNNTSVSNASCNFWVSLNDTSWDWGNNSLSNQTGYCKYTFTPNASYTPGQRWWKAGTYQDPYYQDNNSTNFSVKIYGKLSVNITTNQNLTRDNSNISAVIRDEFNSVTPIQGYNCTWYINGTQKDVTTVNSSGYCNYSWPTNCLDLNYYLINVTLTGNESQYYYLGNTNNTLTTALKDNLNITIVSPASNSIYHEGDLISLNSTVNDSCGLANYSYNLTWAGNSTTDVYWQSCNMSKNGYNNSYTVEGYCDPGDFLITANANGEFYNLGQKTVLTKIYGWSSVNISLPINQTVNRTESQRTVLIVCQVKDVNRTYGIDNYPIKIWEKQGSSEVLLNQGLSNFSNPLYNGGYVNYTWNISDNSTIPDGSYTIKCNITDASVSAYRNYNATQKESSKDIIILDYDTTPPSIDGLSATSTTPGNNVTIEANLTDLYGVDKAWANVTFPNSFTFLYKLQNITPTAYQTSTWRTTTEKLNQTGDYDFVLYTNDTSNNTNQMSSWFEIYNPIQMFLNASFPVDFTFYRPGTTYIIHKFNNGTGYYNFTLHKRNYDFVLEFSKSTIKLSDFNTTATAELQFNDSNANITNPINLTKVENYLINLPDPTIYKISAIEIKTNASYSNVTVTFNYSEDILNGNIGITLEPNIRIYKCSDWIYPSSCVSGWNLINSTIDYISHIISTTQTSTSVYAAAEMEPCGNGKCVGSAGESCTNCPQDCGTCSSPNPSGSPGGPSGSITGQSTNVIQNETKFSIRTNLTDAEINTNESKNYALWISNDGNRNLSFSVSISGPISEFVSAGKSSLPVEANKEGMITLIASAPSETEVGTYSGQINVVSEGKTQSLPVTLKVSIKGLTELDIMTEDLMPNKEVNPDRIARFRVMFYNLGVNKNFDANVTYSIKKSDTEDVVYSESLIKTMESSYESYIKEILIPANITLGSYLFEVKAHYGDNEKTSTDLFEVVQPFWTADKIVMFAVLSLLPILVISIFYGRRRYTRWKVSKARYIFPVNMDKLPKGALWLGTIAETNIKAKFDMNDLTTHVLVAGATGSGKSVSGSIIAEELLDKKIPIVVFDPTAQWTGFVRPCKDANVLRFYKKFGLSQDDARPFKGMIYEVTSPDVEIDFKKYMNPGEITVFTLNKLKPGEYDEAVINIIDAIFSQGWEESTKLELVIVFDEVHRLLEKYGGKGGYVALERACREFRKWGIGLVMISQVLSDFKEAIKGNVMTEVQLHTKSLGDLTRIEKKYGLEYAKKVAKEEIGVGMMQNPKYNEGIPWFISFRPPFHMPHKIPDKEMQTYKDYSKAILEIESELEILEKEGVDIFDMKTELKLAKDKLKLGSFRMAEIYITSLKKKLVDFWIKKYSEGNYGK